MPIPISQLVQVAIKSYVNAEDLLNDAEVLYANERWARTFYLSNIAAEEMAKSLISLWAAVRVRLGEFDSAQEQRYRDIFRDHKMKTATLQAIEDFFWSKRTVAEIAQSLNRGNSDVANHERIKLSALYADFDGTGGFCPGHFFTASNAELPLNLTRRRMEIFCPNIVPVFDVVETCDVEHCRTWMQNLGPIL